MGMLGWCYLAISFNSTILEMCEDKFLISHSLHGCQTHTEADTYNFRFEDIGWVNLLICIARFITDTRSRT